MSSRRAFIKHTTASAAALAALGGTMSEAQQAMPIVDCHQHLWDLSKFKLPWLSGVQALNKSHVMKDYFEATTGLNVVKSVYMEVDVEPSQQVKEAEYVIDLSKRKDNPMMGAVISGRPASPGFRKYIMKFKGSPYIKGVRQVLHPEGTPRGLCLEPAFIKSVHLLGDLGMSYDICMRNTELTDAAKLVDACPGTRFILDHCGNANVQKFERGKSDPYKQWAKDIGALAKRKNIICKVSGIVASAKPDEWKPEDLEPIVMHVINSFGWDRVIFGGDWPVCTLAATYKQWVEALKQIIHEAKPEEQRALLHDNAMKFYGLRNSK